MRRLILFFCSYLTCVGVVCAAVPDDSKPKTSLELLGLNGARAIAPQRKQVVIATQSGAEQVDAHPSQEQDLRFNRNGWLTQRVNYTAGEKFMEGIWFRDGSILLSSETTIFSQYPGPRKQVQTNDAHGRPMELLIYLHGTLKERTERQYEAAGIRELTYDGSGKLLDDRLRTEQEQRTNGAVAKQTLANGKLESLVTRDGSRTENVYYAPDGAVRSRQTLEAGRNEDRGAVVTNDGLELAWSKDKAGNDFQIVDYPKGSRLVTTRTPSILKTDYYDRSGKFLKTITITYDEYDEHGNWTHSTQSTTLPNSEPRVELLTTRKIIYYE